MSIMPDSDGAPNETDALTAVGPHAGGLTAGQDCDPFLKITIPSLRQSRQTRHQTATRNPDWDETLEFTGVTGTQEVLDIRCMDHDIMSTNEAIGEVFYRATSLTKNREVDVWLDLTGVPSGRVNLRLLLKRDGTLQVTVVCGRDLYAQDKFEMQERKFHRVGQNVREAWDEEDGIPDQTTLPLRPGKPVCARLVSDGFCIFGDKCQFHHPPDIKRKAKPPPELHRLKIVQGLWGYLREGRTVDVTEMLKDIVIEQQGIQLELPKKMKHMLWRKRVGDLPKVTKVGAGGGVDGDGSGSEASAQTEVEEEEEQEGGDEDVDEEGEEDPDAPKMEGLLFLLEWIKDGLMNCCAGLPLLGRVICGSCVREPKYGLKIWYMVKGDRLKIQSWRANEWVYIESYYENRKRMRIKKLRKCCCCVCWMGVIMMGFWINFLLAGMSCEGAAYVECFDADEQHLEPCTMKFEFPVHKIRHINISTGRGTIVVNSTSLSPNISIEIAQTVLDEGSMSGLTSDAILDDAGTLQIHSTWSDKHGECDPDDENTKDDCEVVGFPDMYGGPISMFNSGLGRSGVQRFYLNPLGFFLPPQYAPVEYSECPPTLLKPLAEKTSRPQVQLPEFPDHRNAACDGRLHRVGLAVPALHLRADLRAQAGLLLVQPAGLLAARTLHHHPALAHLQDRVLDGGRRQLHGAVAGSDQQRGRCGGHVGLDSAALDGRLHALPGAGAELQHDHLRSR
jgi:hypothetical protein